MDNQLYVKITEIFSHLHTQISMLDLAGNSLIPQVDLQYILPDPLKAGVPITVDKHIFLQTAGKNDYVLMTNEESEASKDVLLMADAMVQSFFASNTVSGDSNSIYQRILQNEMSVAEMEAVISEYHVNNTVERCVLLLHMVQVQKSSAIEILSELLPQNAGDILVSIDRHTVALMKDITGVEELDELSQFASAVQETLMSETALGVTIGIGDPAADMASIHFSYRQARRAIEIGRTYRPEQTVFIYRSLLLERFLSDLSPETAAHYHSLLFNRKTARLFSDEMLFTIEMFFKKDLNLSDTARQLYIHRNTLVYRLDKVQRQVGLDLRKFEDAVTFKMLLEMKKCFNNKDKAK